jgi:pyruvate/2-oxoglutarate dehydrogenase complex dihydrolipoamide acyltransferase (E2) component
MPTRHLILLPDLGVANPAVSLWLVEIGSEVTEGDRVIEVVAEGVVVDIPAPVSGVLVETFVTDDDALEVGQLLGVIESAPED